MASLSHLTQRHWFLIILPFLAAAALGLSKTIDWHRDGRMAELALLVDACVSLPLLYFLCYRETLSGRQMALRLVGLACLGIWFASWLVPEQAQSLLPHFGWARTAGIVFLVAIELRLVAGAIKMAFSGKVSADQLAKSSGAPRWVARLMLLEARFWRWLWRSISGR